MRPGFYFAESASASPATVANGQMVDAGFSPPPEVTGGQGCRPVGSRQTRFQGGAIQEAVAELEKKEGRSPQPAKPPASYYQATAEIAEGNRVTQRPEPDRPLYPYFDDYPDGCNYLYPSRLSPIGERRVTPNDQHPGTTP